jgi:hypothetical protein
MHIFHRLIRFLTLSAVVGAIALRQVNGAHPNRPPLVPEPIGSTIFYFNGEGEIVAVEGQGGITIFVLGWSFDQSDDNSPWEATPFRPQRNPVVRFESTYRQQ